MNVALRCTRSGSTVYIKVELPGVQTFDFRFDTLNEWSAELLMRAVQDRLGDTAQTVREESYLEGWKAAKAKHAKRKHFDTIWGTRS